MIRSLLVMLTAVALLAAGLVLPPAPVQALDPTLSYDLVANADQADWSNGRVALPFPGSTSDSRGFACHRERVRLENGTTAARVLETHPEWVSGGYILGEYPEMTLAEGTSFYLEVGFLEGATASDGATFQVYWVSGGRSTRLANIAATYDRRLDNRSIDLTPYAGQTGYFTLRVNAGATSAQDWAVWAEAQVLPSGVTITTQSLPAGEVGVAYSAQLQAIGGVPPYTWGIDDGRLPPGLTLDPASGRISGTPTTAGTYPFRAAISDDRLDHGYDQQDLSIAVARAGGTVPTPGLFDFTVTAAAPELTLDLTPAILGTSDVTERLQVDVGLAGGVAQTVRLTVSGLPRGVSAYPVPYQGLPPFTSQVSFVVSRATLPAPGDYEVTITGTAGSITHAVPLRLHVVSGTSGNLTLSRVTPVQVVDTASGLVVGKNTLFRTSVTSTFTVPVTTEVELILPVSDWNWPGYTRAEAGRRLITVYAPGWVDIPRYWSYRKTVTIPAGGTVDLLLPDPADLAVTRLQNVRVLQAPRPAHTAGYSSFASFGGIEYTAMVDPSDRVRESSEHDNYPSDGGFSASASPTSQLSLLYEVFVNTSGEADSYFPGRWDGTALWDFYARMQRLADQSAAHVLGTYPLADQGKLRYHPAATLHWYEPAWYGRITDDQEVMNILEHLSSRAAALGYDRLIAVVPTGWLRSHGQDGAIGITWDSARRSSIVEIQNVDGAPWVVTHEMLHNLGYDDIYSGGVCRVRADNGYWVNETRAIDGSRTYDYMDYAGCSSPQWTTAQRLAYVRDRLPASDDPPVLLFRAILSKSGEVELRPFQVVQGIPDVSVEGGNYAVTVLDGAGRVLAQTRLEVKFQKYLDPGGTVAVDQVPLVVTVPWSDRARTIQLRNAAGRVLASREVSAHAPQVRMTSPRGGEIWQSTGNYGIAWEASDADGDALTFSLAISADRSTWLPLEMDLEGNEFSFDAGTVPPGTYWFKVIASDGVNTAEDVSDGAVTIRSGGVPAGGHSAEFYIGRKYYRVDSETFNMDVAPYISRGRTFLPVRFVAYACGVQDADVSWDPATRTVVLRKGTRQLTLRIGSPVLAVRDGSGSPRTVTMDVAPEITAGRTMLPVRWVAEQFGYTVDWLPATQTVRLTAGR